MPYKIYDTWGPWTPDADADNAPPGVLLRSDNLTRDERGALALRLGSTVLYSGMGTDVHSIRSYLLNEQNRYFAGVDNKLFIDGINSGIVFDGVGDVAFGTDSYQVFMTRGTVAKKYDGSTVHNWGIAAPSSAPTVTASPVVTTTVAGFDNAESPGFTVTEGTRSYVNGYDTSASGATEMMVNSANGRASFYRKWSSDQNLWVIGGTIGGDTDLFDMYAALYEPEKVDTITVMFGLGTGTDPFQDDYFYFDINIKDKDTINIKDPASSVKAVYGSAADRATTQLTPEDVTSVQSPGQVMEVLSRLGRFAGSRSRERHDAVQSSPAWGHFSIPRGQFNRVGSTSGRGWSTIRGFKIVVQEIAGGDYKVAFDSAIFYGGGVRSLTGKYKCGYRFVRNFGPYFEMSPISPISAEITLNQQGLNVTIPGSSVAGADPQANQLWIYIYGGFLDTYYRVAVTPLSASSTTIAIDEFAPAGDGTIGMEDLWRFNQVGLSKPGVTPNTDITVTIRKSEIDAITENVSLEPGGISCPGNIVAIAGPVASRMFVLTEDGWLYPSLQGSPSNFSVYHAIDLRRWGDPKWMLVASGGLHVGMTGDIIRIDGTGDESPDRSQVDLYPTALAISNPPIDAAFYGDKHTLLYHAADGLQTLAAATVSPVSQDGVRLLWMGRPRHGVEAFNRTSGRFRMAVSSQMLYMMAPEGVSTTSTSVIWRLGGNGWERFVYPASFESLYRGIDGKLLAGDNSGRMWQLETPDKNDNGAAINVLLRIPIDDFGTPLQTKTPLDMQAHMETGGNPATLSFYRNGASNIPANVAESFSGQIGNGSIYHADASGIGEFTMAQWELSGSFVEFILRFVALGYREHPPQVMLMDTGYMIPPNGARLGWISMVEVYARSPYDLEVVPVFDDIEQDALPLPVIPNKTSVYAVMTKRGQNKGYRPMIRVRSTSSNGNGNIGAEIYWVRVHFSGSGNETERTITTYPNSVTPVASGVS